MKKILFIIFLVFLSSFIRAETWDSNVLAVYDFENNGNDSSGNSNTLNAVGTPAFKTDIIKYGSYSYYVPSNGNRFDLPVSLTSTVAGLDEWTIEVWFYKIADGGYVHEPILSSAWESGPNTLAINPRDANYFEVRVLTTLGGIFSFDWGDRPEWKHVSFQWSADTDQLLVYVNGSLAVTINSVTSNVFAVSADGFHIGNDPAYGGILNSAIRYDRMIVSSALRNGAETTPQINSPTETVTQTVTQTVTPTVTQTITQTVTQTITQTATPTYTVTPWPEYYLNNQGSKDPHYTGKKTRWVDKILNAIRNK
jgi:hypothetical protein